MADDGTHGSAMRVQVTVKLRRRRCLGRVNPTCNKFDNRLYVPPVTGWKLIFRLTGYCSNKPNYNYYNYCKASNSHAASVHIHFIVTVINAWKRSIIQC